MIVGIIRTRYCDRSRDHACWRQIRSLDCWSRSSSVKGILNNVDVVAIANLMGSPSAVVRSVSFTTWCFFTSFHFLCFICSRFRECRQHIILTCYFLPSSRELQKSVCSFLFEVGSGHNLRFKFG